MKNPLLWLLGLCVISLYIAGFMFLTTSSSQYYSHGGTIDRVVTEQRTPALVSGITCLTIGTGLLVLGVFVFRKRD